jgi:spermidine/putrescine transport system permease protein
MRGHRLWPSRTLADSETSRPAAQPAEARARWLTVALLAPAALWFIVFLVAPLAIMFLHSFWRTDPTTFSVIRDFNVDSYERIFTNSVYFTVLWRSVAQGLVVVAITIAIGFPTAYYIATRRSSRVKMFLLLLMLVPFWTSVLLRSYAWIVVLEGGGAVNAALTSAGVIDEPLEGLLFNRFAVTLSLVQLYLPFMVMAIYIVLEKFDWSLVEAAKDLRAGKLRSFLHVTLPASLPGVLIGSLLVFIPSVGAYVSPALLGGTEGQMIASVIGSQFGQSFNWPLGAALSAVLVVLVGGVIFILLKIVRPWDLFQRGVAR